jgi:hypothetical protein
VNITFNNPIQVGSAFNGIYLWNTVLQTQKMITKTINGNTLTLTAVYPWMSNTLYNVIIPINAVTDQYGNTLSTQYVSTFTTAPPITVTSVNPANWATNVSTSITGVNITFNSSIQAGSAYNSIYLWNTVLQTQKMITKTINGDTLTLTAVYPWMSNTTYTIYIPVNAVTDASGNTLANAFSSNFTTASQ